MGAPVITSCEGGYHHDSRKSRLEWQLPHIDDSNKSGQLEFSIKGHPADFFPVTVTFTSSHAFCDIEVHAFLTVCLFDLLQNTDLDRLRPTHFCLLLLVKI